MKDFEQKNNYLRFENLTLDSAGRINSVGKEFESRSLLEWNMKASFLADQ